MDATQSGVSPPSPRGYPIVGNLLDYYLDPLGFVERIADKYGSVVRLSVAGLSFYQVTDPDDIETVLVTKSRDFGKGAIGADRRLLFGKGLATSDGDLWLRQRRLAQPAFHRQRLATYGKMIVEHADTAIAAWPEDEVVDLHQLMMRLTLEIVAKVLFGAKVGANADEVREGLEVVMAYFGRQMNFVAHLLPKKFPIPGRKRFHQTVARLDEIIFGIIADRRSSGDDPGDLLSTLLAGRDDDGSAMSDQQLRDEVMTMFLAGHETTALALSWTFALLAQNPEAQERLVREIDSVLGDRIPNADDLPNLRYAERAIKESMRVYPPAWILARQARRDVEIGGFRIPAKSFVTISQWLAHRDPRNFADPERYDPDRWDGDLEKRLHKYAYFPFGGGPRVCIGSGFAMTEAILLLCMITQRFQFALDPKCEIVPAASLSLRPKYGVRGVLRRRAPLIERDSTAPRFSAGEVS